VLRRILALAQAAMPARPRQLRLKVKGRIATKVQEQSLMDKARQLREDPLVLLPECRSACRVCPWEKIERQLKRVQGVAESQGKLEALARRGLPLARAYAATLGLLHEGKTPYLATAQYPLGTISYATRGKTTKEALIGVQHYDDPRWRLVGAIELVRKRGLHLYSSDEGLVCTGLEARAPAEFVEEALLKVRAQLREAAPGMFACPHPTASGLHLQLRWHSADRTVELCRSCASAKTNTLTMLAQLFAAPDVLRDFEVSTRLQLRCEGGHEPCPASRPLPLESDLEERYAHGKLSDAEVLEAHAKAVEAARGAESTPYIVVGDVCLGTDARRAAALIGTTAVQQKALEAALRDPTGPLVFPAGITASKVLAPLWKDRGLEVLRALVSAPVAERIYKGEGGPAPLQQIEAALGADRAQSIARRLPSFTGLPPEGRLADAVARAFKADGSAGALRRVEAERSEDHRMRGLTYACLLALDVKGRDWQFDEQERELGRHLQPLVASLFALEGAAYGEKLTELLLLLGLSHPELGRPAEG